MDRIGTQPYSIWTSLDSQRESVCDYSPGRYLGRAYLRWNGPSRTCTRAGSSVLALSVPRPLPSQKFKGMVSGSLHQHAPQSGLGCDMHAGAEVSKRWDIVMMAQV